MTKTLLIVVTALLPVASVLAQSPQAPRPISRADFVKTVDAHFSAIDANHDGKVTKGELASELQREMQTTNARIAQQLRTKFKQLDTNHDGQLSLQEFMAIQPSIHPSETPEQMINRLDTNHDGTLTLEEFRAPESLRFNRLDANHDGIVTPAEIQAAAGHR